MKNKKSKGESDEAQSPPAKMTNFSMAINIFIQLIVVAIAGIIIHRTVKNAGLILYSLHPVFHSIGYLILMSHAILVIADNNVSTLGYKYSERVKVHWLLQATALVFITIAQTAIYVNKDLNGYPHFQSTHSYFGFATYMLTVSATLGGVLTKYSSKIKFVKPALLKIGHGFAGIFVYLMAVTTIFLGLNQSWMEFGDMQFKVGILFALLVSTVYIVSKSFKSFTSRLSKKD